jgi:hypothetical protein
MGWLDRAAQMAQEGVQGVGEAMDWSAEHGKEWQGDLDYYIAQAAQPLGKTPLGSPGFLNIPGVPGAPGSAANVINLHDEGYNGYTGGRAVWEQMQANNSPVMRGLLDAFNPTDPFNAVGYAAGVGPIREGIQNIGLIGETARMGNAAAIGAESLSPLTRVAGAGLEALGKGGFTLVRASEKPGEIFFKYALGKPLGFAAGQTFGRLGLLDPSQETKARQVISGVHTALNELVSNTQRGRGLLQPNVQNMAPRSPATIASPKLRGSAIGQRAESVADRALNALKQRFGSGGQVMGFAQGMPNPADAVAATGIVGTPVGPFNNIPQNVAGVANGQLPTFTSEDLDNFAQLFAAHIVGRMNETPGQQQLGAMIDVLGRGPSILSRESGFGSRSLDPLMPAIMERTPKFGVDPSILPSPRYARESAFAGEGEALARGEGQSFSAIDYEQGPPRTPRLGDEVAAYAAGHMLGGRQTVGDAVNLGTGYGFRPGEDYFNPGRKVRIRTKPAAMKKASGVPDKFRLAGSKNEATVIADQRDMQILADLQDRGLLTFEVQDGGGFVAPRSYESLMDDADAVGAGGLTFKGPNGESIKQHFENTMRAELGGLWDTADPAFKQEVWSKGIQASYGMYVQAAQEAYLPINRIAELYWKNLDAGQSVDDLSIRYAGAIKRVGKQTIEDAKTAMGQTPKRVSKRAVKKAAVEEAEVTDSQAEDMLDLADKYLTGQDPVMDEIARGDLIGPKTDLTSEQGIAKFGTKVTDKTGEMTKGGAFDTGYSAGGVDPNSMSAQFESDPGFSTNDTLSRNIHGQANPQDLPGGGKLRRNPNGTYPMNFSTLMHAIQRGASIDLGDGLARDWYARAVAEMANLFGLGAMDDVYAFSLLTAATSAQEGPEKNLTSALRLWLVSQIGNDPELLSAAGVSNAEGIRINDIMNDILATGRGDVIGGVRDDTLDGGAKDLPKKVGKKGKAGDRPNVGKLTNAHSNQSAQALGEVVGAEGIPPQGGTKFADYKQSFLQDSVTQAIDRGYGDNPGLRDEIMDAWTRSQSQFTIDRHQNQLNAFGTVAHPFHYRVGRYMGRHVADQINDDPNLLRNLGLQHLHPEAAQAATWYYAKGAKGFSTSPKYNDDIGRALVRRLKALGRDFTGAPREAKIAMIQSLMGDINSEGMLVSPGKVTPQRIANAMPEIMRNVDKMAASATHEPIAYAYRFADPTIYKDTAGKAGIEALNMVRGQTATLSGTPIIPWDTPRAEAEKIIRDTLNKFIPALDGPHGNALKLGFYGTPEGYSVDINVTLGDRALAEEIGKATNQIAAFDNNTFSDIPTGGTGDSPIQNGDQMNEFLDRFMQQRMGEHLNLDINQPGSGAERGIQAIRQNNLPPEIETLLHMTTMNLGYMRAKMQPFFDLYQASGVRASLADVTEQGRRVAKNVRMRDLKGLSRKMAAEIATSSQPVKNPLISDAANKALYDQGFTKGPFEGQTIGDTFNTLFYTIKDLQEKMQQAGIKWVPDADLKTKQGLAWRIPGSKDTIKMVDGYGMDALGDRPEKIAADIVEKELEKEFNLKPQKLTGYKLFKAAWGEQALFSPRYHLGNLVGGWMQNILGGRSININPVDFVHNVRLASGKPGGDEWGYEGAKWVEELNHWGLGGDLKDINQIRPATQGVVSGDVSTTSSIGKIASKVVGPKVGKIIGKPFEASKQLAAGTEMSLRGSLTTEVMDNEMAQRVKVLAGMTAEKFDKEGLDATAITTDIFQGSPLQVRQRLQNAGLSDGQAESISRSYANFRRTALDKGLAEQKRIQFSYEYTKLDDIVGAVIPFHYWASRALKFYTEETLRHPVWLYNYVKLQEGMDRMMQDPGTSARQKGFMRVMAGPTGFSLLMNPDSMVGFVKAIKLDSNYEPDGQTSLGSLINKARQHGVGLFPWVDATLNYLGAYGDTYAPDPLGVRHRALAGAAINEFRAHTGMDPATAPYEGFNTKLREFISTTFDAATPDWLGKPVSVKATTDGTMATATQDDLITTRLLAENPNMTNQDVLDVLNNPDDPRFQKAYQEVADAGFLNQLLNIALPVTTKVREDSRDVTNAQLKAIRTAAKQAGVPPSDYQPSPADVQFYEGYKKLTGKAFVPGSYDEAQMKRDLATSTPAARTFTIQKYEYDSIGSPVAQDMQQKITQIANGEWFPTGVTPGNYDENVRWEIAQDWARSQPGYQDYLEMRQAKNIYQDTHPEFAEYDGWRGQMYNVVSAYGPDGLAYYRQRISEQNPAAKSYFDRRIQYILQNNRTATPDQISKMLDGATISPDTWFAVSGRAMSQYDQQTPQAPGGAYYDPVMQPGNPLSEPPQQPQLPSAPTNWMQALASMGR